MTYSIHPNQKPSDEHIWKHILECEQRIIEMEIRIVHLEREIISLKLPWEE